MFPTKPCFKKDNKKGRSPCSKKKDMLAQFYGIEGFNKQLLTTREDFTVKFQTEV